MERVKPLDYNDYENDINYKECKNFNCKECCYYCCCSFCSKNNHRKRLIKTSRDSSEKSAMLPTKTSLTIKSSTTTSSTNPKAPIKATIRATTTSADGMTVLVNDDIPTLNRKNVKNISSENQFRNRRKNLSFNIPNTTTEIAPTTIQQSNSVHEYENIPPLKPKRKNRPAAFDFVSPNIKGVNNNNNNKKKISNKKKKYKNYKIPDTVTTNIITPSYYTDKTCSGDCNSTVDGKNNDGQHSYYDNTDEDIISNIKKEEHDIKLRLSQGCTSLMYACLQGDTGTAVQELREKPEKVHRRDRKNKNVLHYCSSCKKTTDLVAAASVAVRAPELLESADEDGFTPLHLAVIQGNLAMVNLLLANKADVNAVDNEGHSVVHWATVCGEIEALRSVLQAGASVTKPDINGGSPLHYAAQMCGAHYEGKLNQATSSKLALEILTILLNHPQSSVDVTDKDGRQPLLWAASAGSAKAVIALVKAGARVESSDKDGLTALHCAASRGHTECIDTLISLCGAPTDLIDSNGCTALHYAVTLGHADATSRLLDLEADPNRQDRKGRTPAHCGCAKGQLETVKLLKERGANLWLRNAKGDLPLHEAASSGRRELVEWLLDQRPKQVNTTSNDGRTMLHIAANNDYTDMCKMLIDFGGDTNCIYRNSKGVAMTPLDCSLQKGYRSTAKFLQSNGGLPASKLRLSGRHPNAFNDQELVKPLKYAEKEEVHDLKNQKKYIIYSKRSDSESSGCSCTEHVYKREHHVNHVCKHHRKRLRRRTSSCGEVDEIGNQDNCSDISRSKSNIEIRRKRSKEQVYTSDEGDSCEVCCRHKRRYKSKKKDRGYQKRYKEITYSEEDDEGERIRNQRKLEKEKGKYSRKADSKSNLYTDTVSVKNGAEQDDVDRSSSTMEKSQRPQSAKKHRQQSKEATFIKTDALDEPISSTTGALDVTDDDEIPKSEVVITQVQIHKPVEESSSPLAPTETEIGIENKTITVDIKNLPVEQISKELNEVINDATETVEKITEKLSEETEVKKKEDSSPAPQMSDGQTEKDITKIVDDTKISEQETTETPLGPSAQEMTLEKILEKETVSTTEKAVAGEVIKKDSSETVADQSQEPNDSEEKTITEEQKEDKAGVKSPPIVAIEKLEPTKTETSQDNVVDKVVGTTEQKDITSENLEVITEEKTEEQNEKIEKESEQKETEKIPSTANDADETQADDNNKEKITDKSVQIMVQEEQKIPITQITPAEQVSLRAPVEREQESRRSFTLLPDSPVAVSEVDERHDEIDDSALRKSSFTVLKSDESVENYEGQHDELHENEESSFQIVSSPEKEPTGGNKVSYSSEDAAEVEDEEEDEEQEDRRTGVPGAIYVNNRDGRHSAMAGSISDGGNGRRKRLKRRVKSGGKGRGWRSVEADEESPSGQQASRDQDSGFEPSPRATKTKLNTSYTAYGSFVPKKTIYATIDGRSCSSRIEGRKPGDKNTCNMTAVTKSIHRNIRRYYMERKIFQHLLELKSLQIRSSKLNEAVLVKRAVDDYHKSCIALGAETGGSLRRYPYTEYTFKNFEMFLYETLKSLQKPGTYNFQNINEVYEEAERRLSPDYNTYEKALQCTTKTHRCLHAAHAYTGIPCAAYIPMMNHHTMPKFGFGSYKKSGVGSFYLPKILTSPVKCGTSNTKTTISGSGGGTGTRVSLELSHGKTKQLISLPSEKLDSNKRYYVTFTVKGSGEGTVTGSPGKTKIELSSDGKVIQQTDVTPIEK